MALRSMSTMAIASSGPVPVAPVAPRWRAPSPSSARSGDDMANQFRGGLRPIVYQTQVAPTPTADTLSAAFSAQTRYVRIAVGPVTGATAYVMATFGAGTPATGTSSMYIPTLWAEVFAVGPGEKVALKSVGTTAPISITEFE